MKVTFTYDYCFGGCDYSDTCYWSIDVTERQYKLLKEARTSRAFWGNIYGLKGLYKKLRADIVDSERANFENVGLEDFSPDNISISLPDFTNENG